MARLPDGPMVILAISALSSSLISKQTSWQRDRGSLGLPRKMLCFTTTSSSSRQKMDAVNATWVLTTERSWHFLNSLTYNNLPRKGRRVTPTRESIGPRGLVNITLEGFKSRCRTRLEWTSVGYRRLRHKTKALPNYEVGHRVKELVSKWIIFEILVYDPSLPVTNQEWLIPWPI